MAATGAFAPTNYDFLRSRMIMPAPKLPTLAPRVPAPAPPVNRLPPPIIKMPPTFIPPILIADPAMPPNAGLPAGGSAPSTPPTPAGPADQSTPGGTGTSDLSRLLDMFGKTYEPRELTPQLAPTSITETGTTDGAASGPNYGIIIVVGLAIIGGIWWYMKHKAGAA